MRDTQRGSKSYMEKRRGRREIEVTRRRGGIKRGERNLAIKHFLICFPQFGTLRGSLSSIEKRRGREEGDRGDQEEGRGNQKERDKSSL